MLDAMDILMSSANNLYFSRAKNNNPTSNGINWKVRKIQ